jgi:subtilisin family serine protease
MKKLLYTGAALSVISIITYFNLTNIANWWVAKKDAQAQQELKKAEAFDTLPYFKNQYIITFPKNVADSAALVKRLTTIGLKLSHSCDCSDRPSLWEPINPTEQDLIVDLEPDTDPPIPPAGSMMRKLDPNKKESKLDTSRGILLKQMPYPGAIITRNYKLIEPTINEKLVRPLADNPKRYNKNASNASKVLVATIDSGVDPTVPGVNSSLFRNSTASFICPTTIEGIYGWNALKTTNTTADVEPIDTDEKCYGLFSVRLGHGTLINGIIAGMGWYPNQSDFTNDVQVNIELLNVRFINQRENKGSLFHALCGINYALDKGAKVINASWRLPINADKPSVKAHFRWVLSKLITNEAILVAAAGNDAIANQSDLEIWPAAFSRDVDFKNNVIAVGGLDTRNTTDNFAPTTNQAGFIDVYAPSMEIRMYNRIPSVPFWQCPFIFDKPQSGTSYATPFVARQVAILKGTTSLTPKAIKAQIISGTTLVGTNARADRPAL